MTYILTGIIIVLVAIIIAQTKKLKKITDTEYEKNVLLLNLEHEKDYYRKICTKYEDVLGKAIEAGEDEPEKSRQINKQKK